MGCSTLITPTVLIYIYDLSRPAHPGNSRTSEDITRALTGDAAQPPRCTAHRVIHRAPARRRIRDASRARTHTKFPLIRHPPTLARDARVPKSSGDSREAALIQAHTRTPRGPSCRTRAAAASGAVAPAAAPEEGRPHVDQYLEGAKAVECVDHTYAVGACERSLRQASAVVW